MGSGDSLIDSLVFLTRYFEKPYSADVIQAKLSSNTDGLSLSEFEMAAQKSGLNAKLERKRLKKIADADLPALLLLNDETTCILTSNSNPDALYIKFPGKEPDQKQLTIQELESLYSGRAFFISKSTQPHETEQDSASHSTRPSWFFKAFAPHWWTYAQVVLAALMINIFALASPLFIMNVYDRVLPNNSIPSLWVMATGILIVFLFDFLIKNIRSFFIDYSGKRVDMHLADTIVDRVLDMRLDEKPASSGEYANLLRELEALRDFFTSATLLSIIDLPFIFIFILIFWIIAGPLAIVLVITFVLIFLLGLVFHFPLQKTVSTSYKDGHKKHSILVETVFNLETIKSIRAERRFRNLWSQTVQSSANSNTKTRLLSQFVVNATALIQQLAYVSIVIYGVYLIQANQITTGALIACVILNGRAMAPMTQITLLLTRLHHSFSAFKGLNNIMHRPIERPESTNFLHRPDLRPAVEFKAVSFAYPNTPLPALQNTKFKINPGEKVGIIGRSGSGKTTIGKLLIGLYTPTSGSILMDSTDIRQVDPIDLRKKTGVVTQDVILFKGSIKDNILMAAPHVSDDVLLNAARTAGVDDFIRNHPMGYDLNVNERGEGLSGGQKQSIGVARALINSPELLIMDEPTSAMDNSSEAVLKERLMPQLADKTLILITHKISMLDLVDRLIVLDKGHVVADGNKNMVLENLAQNRIKAHQ